jgi:hypothetical protein
MDYDTAIKFAEKCVAKFTNSDQYRKSALHAKPLLHDRKGWQVAFEFNLEHCSYKEWIGIRDDFYNRDYDFEGMCDLVQIIIIFDTNPITWWASHINVELKEDWKHPDKWCLDN